MKWIFFSLLLLNALMLGWRYGIGLPQQFTASSDKTHAVQIPANVATINLLGDGGAPGKTTADGSSKPICTLVGPFSDVMSANTLIQRLAALDALATLEKLDLGEGKGYWVYLEPEPTREFARRRLVELQARGIDSYIIPKGELTNGISLGMYTQASSAQSQLRDMKEEGLEPKIQEIDRAQDQIWVMLKPSEKRKIGDKTLQKFISEGYGSEERQNFCLDVASEANFQ